MNLRPFSLLVVATFVTFQGVASAATAEAEKRLHTAVDQVLAIADRAPNGSALAVSLRPTLEKYLSFAAMTRRAVGPGWRQFTKAQQDNATALFTTLVIRTYSSKFTPGEHPVFTYKAATEPRPVASKSPPRCFIRAAITASSIAWKRPRAGASPISSSKA